MRIVESVSMFCSFVCLLIGYKDKHLINTKFKNIKIFINYFLGIRFILIYKYKYSINYYILYY